MNPQELKQALSSGLLSFPLTDFDAELRFDPAGYAQRLEWLMPYGATVLFAAGGTGEFFSLEPGEYTQVIQTATDTCRGRVPIVAGAGGGTTLAIRYAQEAERAGAQGILLLPHYLTEASQDGLVAHVEAVCRSVKIGVIVYNRAACKLSAASLLRLAERCPNLVGFKDGLGDIERIVQIRQRLGDRFAYVGGMPTHEVYAGAYKALGVPVYSSAVFNFVPRTAIEFYNAQAAGDTATTAGWYLVPTAQPFGVLAAYLLEPASEDGVVTWNFLDRELEAGGRYPLLRLRSRPLVPAVAVP